MTDYILAARQLSALTEGVNYDITNLANASALLNEAMDRINWVGFYLLRDGQLVLGPFQGKTACTVIAMGRGVCGTAAQRDEPVVVPDVHRFPGHIACDSASRSEIVLPIHRGGSLYGVLDIDSPLENRFSDEDLQGLQTIVRILEQALSA